MKKTCKNCEYREKNIDTTTGYTCVCRESELYNDWVSDNESCEYWIKTDKQK